MIVFSLEKITPAKAAEYLAKNTGNRKPRMGMAAKIARDIEAGKWEVTHQPIAFDCNGRLIDGQHRLQAIILSQRTVSVFVARYEREVNDTMYIPVDEGVKRSHADVLHLTPRMAQVCNVLVAMKQMTNKRSNSSSEVQEMHERHGDLIERLMALGNHRTYKFRTAATVIATVVLTIRNNPAKAEEIETQWRHFVTFDDLGELQPSITALLRFADRDVGLSNRFAESICRTAYAFDPKNWGTKISRLSDQAALMRSIEEMSKRVL
jgi:hypothetical protein